MFIFYMTLVDSIGTFIYDYNSYIYVYIFIWIIIIPLFYALWSYSYKMNYIWEIAEND